MGITTRTLARRLARYKAEGDDADVPPFIIVGQQRRWRYDYLVAFRDSRTRLRGLQVGGYPAGSVLTAEMAAPPHKALTVPEVVRLIEEWKYRELHLRHQAVAASAVETAELLETHRAERRILFDEKNNRRTLDDPGVMEACEQKALQVAQPEGTIYSPRQLAPLMRTVWEHVLEEEGRWLMRRI